MIARAPVALSRSASLLFARPRASFVQSPTSSMTARCFRSTPRRACSKPAPAEAEPVGFEPDTPTSRRIYLACLGGLGAFISYAAFVTYNGFYSTRAKQEAEQAVRDIPLLEGNPVVYMDVEIDTRRAGRIVAQLRKDICPKAAENFRVLCTGEKGYGFRSSRIHAIIPGQYIAGGDFQYGTGDGGASIYGEPFEDENHTLRHVGPGILSMHSVNPNENTSQFFISLGKAPIHDGRYVVFGNVISGFEVLRDLEAHGDWKGNVDADVRVVQSGELRLPKTTESPAVKLVKDGKPEEEAKEAKAASKEA